MQILGRRPPGTLLLDQRIPKSGGGYWPHAVDLYVPTTTARRALCSLHGGGGTGIGIAQQARVLLQKPQTAANVNWPLLEAAQLLYATIQGQTCTAANAVGNAWNPNGVTTVSDVHPTGVPNWSNGYFWSGSDDVSMLQDFNAWLRGSYGALEAVHLHGHSSGGMLVMRMLRDSPATFSAHLTTSGPLPASFGSGAWPASTSKPLWMQFGRSDDVLGILGGVAGAGDHWGDATWSQQPDRMSVANVSGAMVGDVWVPSLEHSQAAPVTLQAAVDVWNTAHSLPAETYAYGSAVVSTTAGGHVMRTWDMSGGNRRLRLIEGVGHKFKDQQAALGVGILREMLAWIRTV